MTPELPSDSKLPWKGEVCFSSKKSKILNSDVTLASKNADE